MAFFKRANEFQFRITQGVAHLMVYVEKLGAKTDKLEDSMKIYFASEMDCVK